VDGLNHLGGLPEIDPRDSRGPPPFLGFFGFPASIAYPQEIPELPLFSLDRRSSYPPPPLFGSRFGFAPWSAWFEATVAVMSLATPFSYPFSKSLSPFTDSSFTVLTRPQELGKILSSVTEAVVPPPPHAFSLFSPCAQIWMPSDISFLWQC